MKNIFLPICKKTKALLTVLFIASSLFAQTQKGDHVLTVGSFVSLTSDFRRVPFNAMYDYGVTDHFSLGAGYARNSSLSRAGWVNKNNYGLRALYHFGETGSNADLYLGARVGISQWTSKALADDSTFLPYALDGLFDFQPVKAGKLYPSAQLVFGGRYLFSNWLGITSEAAIGSPYFFSIGLSMNVNHTGESFSAIGEAYRAELQPVEKKNVVKISAGSLLGIPGLAYERHLTNRFAFEAGGAYQLAGSVQGGSYTSESGIITESDSFSNGWKAYGLLKFYITAQRNAFPQGWYAGAIYNYKRIHSVVHVEDLHPVQSPVDYDYEKETEFQAGGLVIGYQRLLKKHFTLDVFGGLQYGRAHLVSMRYFDPGASEENFHALFGEHQVSLIPRWQPVVMKISVGYAF